MTQLVTYIECYKFALNNQQAENPVVKITRIDPLHWRMPACQSCIYFACSLSDTDKGRCKRYPEASEVEIGWICGEYLGNGEYADQVS